MRVVFSKRFKKKYNKLQSGEVKKCDKRLKYFEEEPYHPFLNNHPLSGEYEVYRSINVTGGLRAVYKPLKDGEVAYFVDLNTHSELYE